MPGISDIEGRTQFTLWCILGAPLFLGTDVRNMSQYTADTIGNREAIAINQVASGTAQYVHHIYHAYHYIPNIPHSLVAVTELCCTRAASCEAKYHVVVVVYGMGYECHRVMPEAGSPHRTCVTRFAQGAGSLPCMVTCVTCVVLCVPGPTGSPGLPGWEQ